MGILVEVRHNQRKNLKTLKNSHLEQIMSCGDGKVDPLEDCDFGLSIDRFEAECCDLASCRWEPLCDRRLYTNSSDYDLDPNIIDESDDQDLYYDRGIDPVGEIDETTKNYLDEDELFPWMVGAGIMLFIIIVILSICLVWCHFNQRKLAKDVKNLTTKYETILIEKDTIDARLHQVDSFSKMMDSRGNSNMAINIQNFVWDSHHERQSSSLDVVPLKDVKEWVAAKELELNSEENFNKTAPPKMITDVNSSDGPPLPPKRSV